MYHKADFGLTVTDDNFEKLIDIPYQIADELNLGGFDSGMGFGARDFQFIVDTEEEAEQIVTKVVKWLNEHNIQPEYASVASYPENYDEAISLGWSEDDAKESFLEKEKHG